MNCRFAFYLAAIGLSATLGLTEDRIMRRPPRPIESDNELVTLLRDTRIGDAYHYRNLTVFPLLSSSAGTRGYWTLDNALAKGVLRITEKGQGTVPELLVENRSDEPIFLMAGEIVAGGKQNRVISQDILLAPRSGPISLGVFCVEQGRWTRQSDTFAGEKEMAHGKLREQLGSGAASQDRVWGEVSRKSAAVAPAERSSTGDLGAMYEDRKVQRNLDEYSKAMILPAQANGMAVLINGRIVGVELFGDTRTFAKLRDKLLRSYAVDALESPAAGRFISDKYEVERFLRRVEDARFTSLDTVGVGRLFRIDGSSSYGTVLLWAEQRTAHCVVHASIFAQSRMEPQPLESTPRPLPYR